jgi:hypothetical protein
MIWLIWTLLAFGSVRCWHAIGREPRIRGGVSPPFAGRVADGPAIGAWTCGIILL